MKSYQEYRAETEKLKNQLLALQQEAADGTFRKVLIDESTKHLEHAKNIYEDLQLRVQVITNEAGEVVGYAFGNVELATGKKASKTGKKSGGGKGGGRGLSTTITDRLVEALKKHPQGLNQGDLAKQAKTGALTVGKHIEKYPEKFEVKPEGRSKIITLKV